MGRFGDAIAPGGAVRVRVGTGSSRSAVAIPGSALRQGPDGDYVFLEVNPAGQWLFIELETGQPVSAAVARLLGRLDEEVAARAA